MRCPYCGHAETGVIETRESDESVRRRRECKACRERFTTYERYGRLQGPRLIVLGAAGGRRPFDRRWLAGALAAAGVQLPDAALQAIAGSVETELRARGNGEVSTGDLAALANRQAEQQRGRGNGRAFMPTAQQIGAILDASCAAQLPLPMDR